MYCLVICFYFRSLFPYFSLLVIFWENNQVFFIILFFSPPILAYWLLAFRGSGLFQLFSKRKADGTEESL